MKAWTAALLLLPTIVTPAFSQPDEKLQELADVGYAYSRCHLELKDEIILWTGKLIKDVPKDEMDELLATAKENFETRLSDESLVAICWPLRDRLYASGWLK